MPNKRVCLCQRARESIRESKGETEEIYRRRMRARVIQTYIQRKPELRQTERERRRWRRRQRDRKERKHTGREEWREAGLVWVLGRHLSRDLFSGKFENREPAALNKVIRHSCSVESIKCALRHCTSQVGLYSEAEHSTSL